MAAGFSQAKVRISQSLWRTYYVPGSKSEASAPRTLSEEDNFGIASSSEVLGLLSLSSGTITDQLGNFRSYWTLNINLPTGKQGQMLVIGPTSEELPGLNEIMCVEHLAQGVAPKCLVWISFASWSNEGKKAVTSLDFGCRNKSNTQKNPALALHVKLDLEVWAPLNKHLLSVFKVSGIVPSVWNREMSEHPFPHLPALAVNKHISICTSELCGGDHREVRVTSV